MFSKRWAPSHSVLPELCSFYLRLSRIALYLRRLPHKRVTITFPVSRIIIMLSVLQKMDTITFGITRIVLILPETFTRCLVSAALASHDSHHHIPCHQNHAHALWIVTITFPVTRIMLMLSALHKIVTIIFPVTRIMPMLSALTGHRLHRMAALASQESHHHIPCDQNYAHST